MSIMRINLDPLIDNLIKNVSIGSSSPTINDKATLAIKKAFEDAHSIRFENGKDDEFRQRLFHLIRLYGNAAVEAIKTWVFRRSTDPEVVSVALMYLGEVDHQASYRQRFALLIQALSSSFPEIRDGAVLGLDMLGERETIVYLENAITRENNPNVLDDMRAVLRQLRG